MGRNVWHAQRALMLIGLLLVLVAGREFAVADNGDFTRSMLPYTSKPADLPENWPVHGTKDWQRRFFAQPRMYWTVSDVQPSPGSTWFTSAHVFWRVGAWLNASLFSPEVLSLRMVGLPQFLIHAGLFLCCMFAMRRGTARSLVGQTVILLIFCDSLISSYYNSFYSESAAITGVLILFTAGIAASGRSESEGAYKRFLWILLVATALLVLAKRQYLYGIGAFLAAGVVVCVGALRKGALARILPWVVTSFVAMLAVAGSSILLRASSQGEPVSTRYTTYHALYYGAFMFSSDSASLISNLGLPAESRKLVGKSAFAPESESFIASEPALSPILVLRAVQFEPVAFVRLLENNARELGRFDMPLGMVPESASNLPPAVLRVPSQVAGWLAGVPFLFLAFAAAGIAWYFAGRRSGAMDATVPRAVIAFLVCVLVLDLMVSTFDGIQEARRHLLLGTLSGTLLLALAILEVIGHRRGGLEEESKYPLMLHRGVSD